MQIQSVGINNRPKQKITLKNKASQTLPIANDSVNFTGLMPNEAKKLIKLCVYDLDETLLNGSQTVRDKIFDFTKGKTLVYSTARALKKVQPFIDNKILVMPDYCVCNNGINIYKNVNGKLEEITSWSEGLAKKFDKNKVRKLMVKIAKENMFNKEDYIKTPLTEIPEGQKEFRGSKITEYEAYGSPLNIHFIFAPEVYKKTIGKIQKQLIENGIEADVHFGNYPAEETSFEKFNYYFAADVAKDIRKHVLPRLNPDKSVDTAVITPRTDKGKATEYLRNELKLKEKEVFAAGDGENDYTNTNKGYLFALISNACEGLKKLIGLDSAPNIIKTTKPGAEGIWETIEP